MGTKLQDHLPLKSLLEAWSIWGGLSLGAHRHGQQRHIARYAAANFSLSPRCNIASVPARNSQLSKGCLAGLKILKQPDPSPLEPVRLRQAGWGRRDERGKHVRCEAPSERSRQRQCEPSIGSGPVKASWLASTSQR